MKTREIENSAKYLFNIFLESKKYESFNPGQAKAGLMSNKNKAQNDCKSCIYFLTLKGIVVYVGIIKYSVLSRLYEHQNSKFFDVARIYESDWKERDIRIMENSLINMFDPYFNTSRINSNTNIIVPSVDYLSKKTKVDHELSTLRPNRKKGKERKQNFSFRIDENTLASFKIIAKDKSISDKKLASFVIRWYIDNHDNITLI